MAALGELDQAARLVVAVDELVGVQGTVEEERIQYDSIVLICTLKKD
jgi:hypothetical protein